MERLLVSACLLGQPVRYDGRARTLVHALLERWRREQRLIAICPEIAGGLPTPRPAAELAPGTTAADLLAGAGSVLTRAGDDLSPEFRRGADAALAAARDAGCRLALLTDGSPSCGVHSIHDGRFQGRRVPGQGLAAHRLRRAGIEVFAESDIEALQRRIEELERDHRAPERRRGIGISAE